MDPTLLRNNIECLNRNLSWIPVDTTDPLYVINRTYPACGPQVEDCVRCGDACERTVPGSPARCTGVSPECDSIDATNEVAESACASLPGCTWMPGVNSTVALSSCTKEMAAAAQLGGIGAHSSEAALALSGCTCGAPTPDMISRYCPYEAQECALDSACRSELIVFAGCGSFEPGYEFSQSGRALHACVTAALSAPPCTTADNCVGCTAHLYQEQEFVSQETPGFCVNATEPDAKCAPIGGVCRRSVGDPWTSGPLPDLCFHDSAACENCAAVVNTLEPGDPSGLHKLPQTPTGAYSYPSECLSAVICARPDDNNGVDFSSATESLRVSDFSVTGASCGIGFGGTASVASCTLEAYDDIFGLC